VAKGATDQELQLYLLDCQRLGVDPLHKLIHFTVRTDRNGQRSYTPIVSIDYLRMRAESSGKYAGSTDPVIERDADGRIIRAVATVRKLLNGTLCEYSASAYWASYAPTEEKKAFMWNRFPELMIGKCAEALALRRGFPGELHGLYIMEELHQEEQDPQTKAGSVIEQIKQRATRERSVSPVTPPQTTVPVQVAQPQVVAPQVVKPQVVAPQVVKPQVVATQPQPQPQTQTQPQKNSTKKISQPQRRYMFALAKNAGMDNDRLRQHIQDEYGVISTTDLDLEQYDEIISYISGDRAE
jgi:phage recombination protein Bet